MSLLLLLERYRESRSSRESNLRHLEPPEVKKRSKRLALDLPYRLVKRRLQMKWERKSSLEVELLRLQQG